MLSDYKCIFDKELTYNIIFDSEINIKAIFDKYQQYYIDESYQYFLITESNVQSITDDGNKLII